MRPIVHPVSIAICLAVIAAAGAGGCRKEAKPPPPPTQQQVESGLQKSVERVRNDPNLTPQQKEQALRMLEGMAAANRQQPQRGDDER
ncbi:MAG: hypothetical protein HUU17_05610 [Chthonomonadales bacterium]|nr:hypothetical protein [Chthonomonadales bacterium]